jgi:methionine synthase II (cobalamin-independent)
MRRTRRHQWLNDIMPAIAGMDAEVISIETNFSRMGLKTRK